MSTSTHRDIEAYLDQEQHKELLRFVFVGSVDDGKSTLIGRLLHDSNNVYTDHLEAVKRISGSTEAGEIDFSLFTDGLKAEREQGITIDVAYRYFATSKRKYIVADTPGHVQYTRNMVTGASTANVAVILIDARLGVLEQSKRHAYIASLLGIPHLAVAINKMDLMDYRQEVFTDIENTLNSFSKKFNFQSIQYFPVSALCGDNVVTRSEATPWYEGPTLLEYLETVPSTDARNTQDWRFPVQYVLRPNLDYRGFAGSVISGHVSAGDAVVVLPSAKKTRIKAVDVYEGEVSQATVPQSVTLRLEDEIDISRGDMLVHPGNLPEVNRKLRAHMVWMHERGLDRDKTYVLKHTTQSVRVQIDTVHYAVDPDSLEEKSSDTLQLNDIGSVSLTCHRPIYYDAYTRNRATGSFILIDSLDNSTVAAGMIQAGSNTATSQDLDAVLREVRAGSGLELKSQVSVRERRERMGQRGVTVWLTGLPGSGRWALAYALERRLFDLEHTAHVIVPSYENLEAITTAAKACTDAGLIAICAFPSYQRAEREEVRQRIGTSQLFEVFVDTDPALCRERRPNASTDTFETPQNPALTVALDRMRVPEAVRLIVDTLINEGWLLEDDA